MYDAKALGQSPLPTGERGKGADLRDVQNLSSTRAFRSMYDAKALGQPPIPRGRGEREPISMLFNP
ncbi:hypothetical protein BI292_26515 [Pseudomonas sp. 43NM1]|nr:hypothetical protein BI292_26515 [Pseudomonas sp. 43NM1]